MLVNDLLVWAQNNLRSLKAAYVPGKLNHGTVKEQCLLRVMDALPARSSENLGSLWQSSSRPLRLRKQLSLPNLFHKEHGCPGTQTSQGATAQTHSNSPPLEEPAVGVGVIPAARNSSVADPLETGPPLSSERHDMASTAWVMGPACVAAQREPFGLPKHVLNTMELDPLLLDASTLWNGPFSWLGVKTVTLIWSPLMCQWFSHFCRRCWINSAPHPLSKFTRQP